MIPVHFMYNGTAYTRVEIPDWMRASKLISDHLKRGDIFAVDDRTRSLSVVPKEVMEASIHRMPTLTEAVKGLMRSDTLEVDVQFYRNKLRELSASAKAALGE